MASRGRGEALPIFRRRKEEPQPEVILEPLGTLRRSVLINVDPVRLPGDLVVPMEAVGVAIFAHGSGSSRQSPRNLAPSAVC